jgi:hypothetical protein
MYTVLQSTSYFGYNFSCIDIHESHFKIFYAGRLESVKKTKVLRTSNSHAEIPAHFRAKISVLLLNNQ